jgi:periplasmic mercuric ion binding protein
MKTLLGTLAVVLLASGAAMAAPQKAKIEVSELFCPSCPLIAAQAVNSIDSVEIIEGDYNQDAQTIVFLVSFDDAVTNAEEIADAQFEYGYPGRVLEILAGS